MRRHFLLWILTFLVASPVLGQAVMQVDYEEFKVGEVLFKHPTKVVYHIENTGDEPLVMSYVEPECDCSVAEWTQTPIPPGGRGIIEVTFDANILGYFDKGVTVINNSTRNVVDLFFSGRVVERLTDYTSSHPYPFGMVRTDKNTVIFDDVSRGGTVQAHMSIVNVSGAPYSPVLMRVPAYLDVQIAPETIGEGQTADVTLTLNADRVPLLGKSRSSVYVARNLGDIITPENEVPLVFTVLPDLRSVSSGGLKPSLLLGQENVDLRTKLLRADKVTGTMRIMNTGTGNLEIYRAQSDLDAVRIAIKGSIGAGKKTNMKITVDKKKLPQDVDTAEILLITNDPDNPKKSFSVRLR